jgi:hypothetical protein
MYRLLRLWPYGAFLTVCTTGLLLARSQSGGDGSAEHTAWPSWKTEHFESMEDRLHAVDCRVHARLRIARQVSERQLTLLQAAERFRDLNDAGPDFNWPHFRQITPGTTDDERCCRQVIMHVEYALGDDPARSTAERQRLEEELRDHLQRGTLRLPQ